METAEMPAAVAAAGVPAADKSLTVGTVLDTGRTAGDGRTVTGRVTEGRWRDQTHSWTRR